MKYSIKRKGILKLITSKNKYVCTDDKGSEICFIQQTGKITTKFGFDVFSNIGKQIYWVSENDDSKAITDSNWSFDILGENQEFIGSIFRLYKNKYVSLLSSSKGLLKIIQDFSVSGLIGGVQNTLTGSIADMIHGDTLGWYFEADMSKKTEILILPKKKSFGTKLKNLMVSNSGLEYFLIINSSNVSTIKGILNPVKSKLAFEVPDDYKWTVKTNLVLVFITVMLAIESRQS
ncbi:hypothetical protein [Aquimarina sp. Aq78]|uniref:hypothetical protein n=1 Tax=Aquimarina sp. Aq78 TaxID=1191889 RepID=UPI000D1031F4|nr:hypothetical protein [Aquimarina sp. Aq78]